MFSWSVRIGAQYWQRRRKWHDEINGLTFAIGEAYELHPYHKRKH